MRQNITVLGLLLLFALLLGFLVTKPLRNAQQAATTAVPRPPPVSTAVNGSPRHTIRVTGFTGNQQLAVQAAEVLQNDLKLSGDFLFTDSTTALFVQQGRVRLENAGNAIVECTLTLQATQKVVLSRTYRGSPENLRRMVHRLSDDIVQEATGQQGIARTQIAFVLQRGNAKELAVMDYDGYNVRQLTFDNSLSVRPRWSPDGRKLVYTSYVNRFPDVVAADLFSGARTFLARYPGLNSGAIYSPDGKRIALTLSKDGNPELYVMNANGGQLRRLTHTRGAESSPTWSPDGSQIAYVSDDAGSPQIYVISRTGGKATRLTVLPSYNTDPDWSRPPPGSALQSMLAVTSRVGGKFQIGLYDTATKALQVLTEDNADNQNPSWAPNGRHLVFSKTRRWRSELYLLDIVTGEQTPLPSVEGNMSEPAWGPYLKNPAAAVAKTK